MGDGGCRKGKMTELNIEGEGKCSLQKAGKRGGGEKVGEREGVSD